jgi:hypothetical protein
VEIMFFICRVILGIVPTPTIPEIPKQDQPFEWNIYKTLNYFLFTIVGGLVYVCVLFLYFQKLSTGQEEFAQFFNIRPSATPTEPAGGGAGTTSTATPRPATTAGTEPTEPAGTHHHHAVSNLDSVITGGKLAESGQGGTYLAKPPGGKRGEGGVSSTNNNNNPSLKSQHSQNNRHHSEGYTDKL